jgi:hypothetical protein
LTAQRENLYKECDNIGQFTQRREEEWLCDFGAKHLLLLTPKYLEPVMLDLGFSLNLIEYVSTKFQVSFEAAARSIIEITNKPVALVYYTMGYTSSELKQLGQPPLAPFTEFVNTPQPKLRVARAYSSRSFPLRLYRNKSAPEESCITHTFNSDEPQHTIEKHTFDRKRYYQMEVETKKGGLYISANFEESVIALFSNPIQVPK